MNRHPMYLTLLIFIFAVVLLPSCGGDDDDDSSTAPSDDTVADDTASSDDSAPADDADDDTSLDGWFEFPAGLMTIRVRANPYYMEIEDPEGKILVATPEAGRMPTLSPMPYLPHSFKVGVYGDKWFFAKRLTAYEYDGTNLSLYIESVDQKSESMTAVTSIVFEVLDDRHLTMTDSAEGQEGIHYYAEAFRLDDDEHFFGLGLQYDSIDSRGKLRNMFLGLGVDFTDQIQNHAPMPFYISSRGYGLFVEEKGKGYFDMGRDSRTAYGYKYETPELKTHIFYGPAPLDIIDAYTSLTGRPPMNPDYLFGYLHWRNVNNAESEVYSDADGLRSHGIPTSSIMVDAPWQTAYSTFEFTECPSGCQFVDAQAMIDYVHQKGYAFYLWTAEFVNLVSPIEVAGMIQDNSAQYNYAKSHGFLVSVLGLVYQIPWWHEDGSMVNFLNPDAYDWYQNLAEHPLSMGAQGFKMDGGEYIGADTLGLWSAGLWKLGEWSDPRTDYYNYKWNYHQLFWDAAHEYNGDLAISTVRTAVWGEQVHINYFWPGDLESNWGRELGLPADIIGGLNLSTAGFPYYGSNNGGFSDYGINEIDPLLMARWTEYSAFRPIFEGPRGGTQEVWEYMSEEMVDLYRKYTVQHTRMFPYMKLYASVATQTGAPIMRMMPLHYLDDTTTYDRDFDYMLGDWLLVEPVYLADDLVRDVYLPEGRWINYWTNEVHDGPDGFDEDAPMDIIPVYAKAGAIIPLLDPSVETLWPTDDPDVVDHEDVEDLLWLELFPYETSSFTLVDGSAFSMTQSGTGFSLAVSGAPLERTYSIKAAVTTYEGSEPASVTGPSGALSSFASYDDWNAAESGWFYDSATGNLWIRDTCTAGTFTIS